MPGSPTISTGARTSPGPPRPTSPPTPIGTTPSRSSPGCPPGATRRPIGGSTGWHSAPIPRSLGSPPSTPAGSTPDPVAAGPERGPVPADFFGKPDPRDLVLIG